MAYFEDNVLGKVAVKDWLTIGTEVTRQNDPIDSLFGDERTDNLMAYWEYLAAEYQIPVMAQFHSFDAEAQKTFRVPIDSKNVEKGLIKVKINQSERLRALMQGGVQGEQALYDYVINDGLRLAEQVDTRTKVAKNEVLYAGKVTIKENDLDLTVDYGVPDANLAKTLDFGAGADADIIAQLQTLVDGATETGVTLDAIVCGRAFLTKLRQDEAVQKAVNGSLGAGALVRMAALRDFLSDEFGIQDVITNDLTYAVPNGFDEDGRPKVTAKRYFPKDKVSFVARGTGGTIGTGLWGDPPELTSLRRKNPQAIPEVSPYIYVSQWEENDPEELWTRASALFMPVLYNPYGLYVASVTETPAA